MDLLIAIQCRQHLSGWLTAWITCRVSSVESQDSDPSVLLNGHFDTTPGSPGAGDCGSCVGRL